MPNLPADWRAARERKNKKVAEGRMSKSRVAMRQLGVPVILFVLHTVSNKASLNQIKSEHGEAAERNERRKRGMQGELGESVLIEEEHGEIETKRRHQK